MMSNKQLFYYFIQEREKVRIAKESGQSAPWTDDIILQSVRFTNIDREKDTITKLFRQNIPVDRYLYANTVLFRMLNRSNSMERFALIDFLNYRDYPTYFKHTYDMWTAKGECLLSGAYIIGTAHKPGVKTVNLIADVISNVISILDQLNAADTCEQAYRILSSVNNLGTFLTTQVIVDIKNTPGSNIYNDPDKCYFTNIGLGSHRGIILYFEQNVTAKKFMQYLALAHNETIAALKDCGDPYNLISILDYHNLQNCFCEFQKYMRNINMIKSRNKRNYNNGEYII